MDKITKQQIIRANMVFGGKPRFPNSLNYAVEKANEEKNFYKKLAYLVRSMTSDHSFINGNKRTAITIVLTEFKLKGMKSDKEKISNMIRKLAASGEEDIQIIERRLRKCSKK